MKVQLGLLLLVPAVFGAAFQQEESVSICEYNGKIYYQGDFVPADDGCNRCYCGSNGVMACTLKACIQGCFWKGTVYRVDDTFFDGCGVCTCKPKAKIECNVNRCDLQGGGYQSEAEGQGGQQRMFNFDPLIQDTPAL